MNNHLEIIRACRMQAEFLLCDANAFIRQLPPQNSCRIWKNSVLLSKTLSDTIREFSANLSQKAEALDLHFKQLSSFMQEIHEVPLLLSCDQFLREYLELRNHLALFLNVCHGYSTRKSAAVDLAPLYHATQTLCEKTEYFLRRCKEIFELA